MQEKGSGDHSSGMHAGSYPYVRKDTAEHQRIRVHGISEGKEFAHDLRQTCESQVKIRKQKVLVPGILCGLSWEECEKDRGIHPKPDTRRSGV